MSFDWKIADMQQYQPVGGYSPGLYVCVCATCESGFMGEKRCRECHACAVKASEAPASGLLADRERTRANAARVTREALRKVADEQEAASHITTALALRLAALSSDDVLLRLRNLIR